MGAAASGVGLSPLTPFDVERDGDRDELYKTRVYLQSDDPTAVIVIVRSESPFKAVETAANHVQSAEESRISSVTIGMEPVSRSVFRDLRAEGRLYMPESGVYRYV